MTPAAETLTPACYGVCCAKHGSCARYAAVDGAGIDQTFVAACIDGDLDFVPIVPESLHAALKEQNPDICSYVKVAPRFPIAPMRPSRAPSKGPSSGRRGFSYR
jgi:hypothetical protein